MKKLAKLITLIVMTISLPFVVASQNSFNFEDKDERQLEELEKFLQRYSCSQEVEEDLKQYGDPIYMNLKGNIYEIITPNGVYYLKGNQIDRMINALRLERFLQDHKYTTVTVAKKCWSKNLKQVVATGVVCDGRLYISSKYDSKKNPLLIDRVKDEIGFGDWDDHSGNIFINKDGQYVFIDLENSSFKQGRSQDSSATKVSLLYETKYDDADIDFEEVRRQIRDWRLSR